ncbi:hypothetical protein BDV23DRAFT_163753 [Aspergillus alliaceus]|uniref:Uncharacterized protein n=1 Tax=Petromyces alliaceus TaxID=209559 RepID=A0A5N7BWF6_PETAA|nr:hypothetical protein BDV23DRAFT_163753 [Aspergillus alliaceus]
MQPNACRIFFSLGWTFSFSAVSLLGFYEGRCRGLHKGFRYRFNRDWFLEMIPSFHVIDSLGFGFFTTVCFERTFSGE